MGVGDVGLLGAVDEANLGLLGNWCGFGGAVVVGLVVVGDGEERLLVASERERERDYELINK